MAIPKIEHPTFSITIPSSKKKIRMRPYTVKEEKILIAAQASDDPDDMIEAVKQVLTNCIVSDIDLNKQPLFDIEYFFIKLRSISVNNVVELSFTDKEDNNKKHDLEVDLDKVEVRFLPEHTNKLEFSSGVGALLRYPDFATMEEVKRNILTLANQENSDRNKVVDALFGIYSQSIEKLYDEDKVYVAGEDFNEKEAMEFLDNLNTESIGKFQDFFETMPTIHFDLEYTTSEGVVKSIPLSGLSDFFTY